MKQEGLRLSNRIKTTVHQILGTRLSNIIKLSENDFNQLINDIEADPLFENLRNGKIVKYKRFPRAGFSLSFLELNENISTDHTPIDVESIVETKQEAAKIIKKIGIENFKQYFLYNDENILNNEIAEKCRISIDEVKKITDLLNEISIHSEFYNPSMIDITSQIKYYKIASINKDRDGFVINFFSPNLAKGKYEINYEKLTEIKDKKIKSFIRKLELINTRKTTIYQMLERLILHQNEFLNTGDFEKRKLFTQRDLSKESKIDPSIICRSIRNRSVEISSGSEIPLKDFFLNRKDIKKMLVKKVLEKNKEFLSAEKIKQIFKNDYKIDASRRSIAYYINELGKEK